MTLTRYIQPAEGEKIKALRAKRLPLSTIAAQTGRAPRTIALYLDRQGVPRTRAPMKQRNKARAGRVMECALRGLSEIETAAELNLTIQQVRNTVSRRALFEKAELTGTGVLSTLTGLSAQALRMMVTAGEIEHTHWFRRVAFTPEQIKAAQAFIGAQFISKEEAAGWLSSKRAGRELSLNPDTFLKMHAARDPRVQGIVARRVIGMSGNVWRYETQSVLAAARKLPTRNLPLEYNRPGVVLAAELAEIVNRCPSTVHIWVTKWGAPHLRDRTRRAGRIWFDLPVILAWLRGQEGQTYARAAVSLARHLDQRRAA